jgi:hypothetical protein
MVLKSNRCQMKILSLTLLGCLLAFATPSTWAQQLRGTSAPNTMSSPVGTMSDLVSKNRPVVGTARGSDSANPTDTLLDVIQKKRSSTLKGGDGSGGGSYVTIDGRITVADPHYAGRPVSQIKKIIQITYQEFPQEIQQFIDQIKTVCQLLLVCDSSSNEQDRFFDKVVKFSGNRYFLVPKEREQNVPCEHYLPILNRPVEDHVQYGCTFGTDTYLFVDKWNRASIEQQAFALIHERLWVLNENADQADIAHVVHWLQVFSTHYITQKLENDRTPLTAEEIGGYTELYGAAKRLGFSMTSILHPELNAALTLVSGGAVVPVECTRRLTLANSFLDIGSYIGCNRGDSQLTIRDSTLLQSSTSFGPMRIQSGTIDQKQFTISGSELIDSGLHSANSVASRIQSSVIQRIAINNSTIKKSEIVEMLGWVRCTHDEPTPPVSGVYYATVSDSKIYGDCSIVKINGTASQPVSVQNLSSLRLQRTQLIFQEGVSVSNLELLRIGTNTRFEIRKNSHLENLKFEYEEQGYSGFGSYRRATLWARIETVIEPSTELRNGKLNVLAKCYGDWHTNIATSHFYIGRAEGGYKKDLNGGDLEILNSVFNCTERFSR